MRFSPTENRTRGCVQCSVAGNSGSLGMTKGRFVPSFTVCDVDGRIVRFALCVQLSQSLITAAQVNAGLPFCHPDPDFLYVAPSTTACAACMKERGRRSAIGNKLRGNAGGGQPRGLQCARL